jgi:thiamine-phosphate pyrophosphorylase
MEENNIRNILDNRCYIILPDREVSDYIEDVELLLDKGIRLFQLRRKEISFEDYVREAFYVKEILKKKGGFLIIDDNVEVALKVDADGVHLGENDVKPKIARRILGRERIIGYTANTYEDALIGYEEGADYIGLGPFFYTETKKNLKPFVKEDTVRKILGNIPLPVFAIGGINQDNIYSVLRMGIDRVAISSGFFMAKDKEKFIDNILEALYGAR